MDIASIDIGGEVATAAGEMSKATGNELKPTRGGDLRRTIRFPWPRATCSNTFLHTARQAIAPKSLLGRSESAGSCTTRSVAAVHGMGMMPLDGIIRNVDYHRDGVVTRGYTEIGVY